VRRPGWSVPWTRHRTRSVLSVFVGVTWSYPSW